MKIQLYWFPSSSEDWLEQVIEAYTKKINFYAPFQVTSFKPKKMGRDNADQKIKHEEELILSKLNDADYLVVFDEKGKLPKSSIDFSQMLVKAIESSKPRMVFVIGGAFGLSEKVKERANLRLSLSHLTMSHQVAMAMCLEQIYRAFTIWKNHPYHNQ